MISSRSEEAAVLWQVVLLLEAICNERNCCEILECLLSPGHFREGHRVLPWVLCVPLECCKAQRYLRECLCVLLC